MKTGRGNSYRKTPVKKFYKSPALQRPMANLYALGSKQQLTPLSVSFACGDLAELGRNIVAIESVYFKNNELWKGGGDLCK